MNYLTLISHLLLLLSISFPTFTTPTHEQFMQCMSTKLQTQSSNIIHTSNSSSFSPLLQSSQQNPRWVNSTSQRPILILTPFHESEIQASILCSKARAIQIRVRSGGHDYEGLSYLSKTEFILIDLFNLRSVDVDVEDRTAWVQSGATLGELYYGIAKKSGVLGFPAGICPSVGIGGHFSGGGFGTLHRKFGLAADNVLDAYLVDVNGRILDRKLMGEDLFWAIRGGGGASFGVILSWKIRLFPVPQTVTVFTIHKTLAQGATNLINKWQHVADKFPEDLFIRVIIQIVGGGRNQKTVQASFNSLFLGNIETLIPLVNQTFPELGLQPNDCTQMSWIQSVLYIAGYQMGQPLEVLLDRITLYKSFFKAKSDFVENPISETVLNQIWEMFLQENIAFLILDPFGGKMDEISESETPFPHRKGNLYNIQYIVKWEVNEIRESNKHIHWLRTVYRYMTPFVAEPRTAYLNYRDLDLGINNDQSYTSFSEASVWGMKYFKGNFRRLAAVKTKFDPENFFRFEQSIPLLSTPT